MEVIPGTACHRSLYVAYVNPPRSFDFDFRPMRVVLFPPRPFLFFFYRKIDRDRENCRPKDPIEEKEGKGKRFLMDTLQYINSF